jgi:hypothetical protein
MIRAALPLVCLLSFASAAAARVEIATPFDPAEVSFALRRGSASIVGQASFREPAGGVAVPDGGTPVYLIPKSRYTDEWVGLYMRDPAAAVDVTNLDQRVAAFMKRTFVQPGGMFAFQGVPPGRYYVSVDIEVKKPAIISGYTVQKRTLFGEVRVGASGIVRLNLDR